MAGLLGTDWEDPQTQIILALGSGLLSGGFAGGAKGLQEALGSMQARKDKKGLLDLQMESERARTDNTRSEIEQRKGKMTQEQAEREAAQRLQQAIPGLFKQDRMTGGEAQPQTMGGAPMFSQPMQAAPMQQQRGGFDVQGAIRAGLDPKRIQEYAALDNIGRQEVARTLETTDAQGRPVTVQLDKYGNRIGDGMGQWKAPIMQNLGNRTVAIDPVGLGERGSFAQGQSPDSVASNAIAMRGQNMVDARSREGNALTAAAGQSQIVMDPIRGPMIVNKATGLTRPAVGFDGKPILGEKEEAARKNANDVLSLIDAASKIIPGATGSYAGAAADQAARVFGRSPDGADAVAQLKAIQGALLMKMPRMEGPQSNYDVQNYREAIGAIGDPTIPASQKQAALRTVKEIQERYTGTAQPQRQPGSMGSGNSKLIDDLVNKYGGQ